MKLSTISTAFTVLITSAYAQELTVEDFTLFGFQDSTGAYPNYTQGIVVGSVPIHISECFFFLYFLKKPLSKTPLRQNLTMATNIFVNSESASGRVD